MIHLPLPIYIVLHLSLLLTPTLVLGNQVHLRPVTSLDELVDRASHIFVVLPAKPFTKERKIQITRTKNKPGDEPIPDFIWRTQRYKVVDQLHPPQVKAKGGPNAFFVGQTIEVEGANQHAELDLHRRYYLEGVSKSPIYATYEPKTKGRASGPRKILFLQAVDTPQKLYRMVILNAVEPAAHLKRVQALIKKLKQRDHRP